MGIDNIRVIRYTVGIVPPLYLSMTGIRCRGKRKDGTPCNALLFKAIDKIVEGEISLECKCGKCHTINTIQFSS